MNRLYEAVRDYTSAFVDVAPVLLVIALVDVVVLTTVVIAGVVVYRMVGP